MIIWNKFSYRCVVGIILPLVIFQSASSCDQGGITPGGGNSGGDTPDSEQLPSNTEFLASVAGGGTLVLPLEGEWRLGYSGFSEGDKIVFIDENRRSTVVTADCTEAADDSGAVFSVPEKFIGGTCEVTVNTGGKSVTGSCFVSVVDTADVEIKAGYTTYGRVVDYEGRPVPGVSVSDGNLVTVTDSEGRWYLRSQRKNVFVFISVPSGYRVAIDHGVPRFFAKFANTATSVYEKHNFVLAPEDQSRARVLVWSDCHLANRTNDLRQFRNYFKPEIKTQVEKAVEENIPLYAVELGDLAWDEWWYKNDYCLKDYRNDIADMGLAVYSIPGNHDNDPGIADDFLAAAAFRDYMNPSYYSFNIAGVHYIMMDNTIFNNTGGNNVQDYKAGFTVDQMKWFKADLENVPEGSTVMLGIHIQWTNRSKPDGTFTYSIPSEFRSEIEPLLSRYDTHIISGHTHTNYTNRIAENILEHNIAAVCGTWWWTGYYSDSRCRINGDGTPSGYKVFDFEGGDMKWRYQAVARSEKYQFRAYDLRNSLITRALYCPAGSNGKVSDAFFSQYANGWDKEENTSGTRKILLNIFDWAEGWTVSVFENGAELPVKRIDAYDPLHTVLFNMCRMNTNSTAMTFPTGMTAHMFEVSTQSPDSAVQIRVTDSFGRVYEETMTRPRKLYDMSREDRW